MRISQTAAAQMYPHLSTVECEKHDDQQRAKVPSHLKGVFAKRENPDFVCAQCLAEAKDQWDEHQRSLRRAKDQKQREHRESIKKAREDAREADSLLADYIKACNEAEISVSSAEQELAAARSKLSMKQGKHTEMLEQIRKMSEGFAMLEAEILKLSEESLDQFEVLTEADRQVTSCYNTLQDAIDKADHLWEGLGKSAKKKRDKTFRKSALNLLKEHNATKSRSEAVTETSECSD